VAYFKRRLLFSLLFLVVLSSLHAQQLTNIWRFGTGCGLDFSTGSPVNMPVGPMNAFEGCASASDASGQLLFYTDGNKVYNRNNVLMPNGSNLSGGNSATMILILPKPDDCSKFYIFYVHDHFGTGNFYYSIVDMCLDNGFGDVEVASMNTFLHSPTSEKIMAVKHANGTDTWVITHELGSANFRTYLVSAAGVSPATVTTIGSNHPSNCLIGYMKANHSGTKIVTTNAFCSSTEMFDFNNTTGAITNTQNLTALYSIPNGAYGLEFSPNDNLLYISCFWGTDRLYQLNMSTSVITQIATTSGNYEYGALQLGPDQKIYMARTTHTYIDVVNNPNVPGLGCGYVAAAHTLTAGSTCQLGLPTYAPFLVTTPPAPLVVSLGNDTSLSCAGSYLLSPPTPCGASFLWQNNSTAANFNVTAAGTYWVQVTGTCGIGIDTIQVTMANADIGNDTSICTGDSITLNAGNPGATYLWNTGATTQSINVGATGIYWIDISSAACTSRDSISVNLINVMQPDLGADTTLCPNQTLVLSVLSSNASYQWSDGSADLSLTVDTPGTYWIEATEGGCRNSDTVNINVLSNLNLGPDITLCDVSVGVVLDAHNPGSQYLWSTGETTQAISVNGAGTYSVAVGDLTSCLLYDTIIVSGDFSGGMLYIPNCFTPNGDTRNDIFKAEASGITTFHMQIFNRWGEMVFESFDINDGWDGTYKSEQVQEDVYAVKLNYTNYCTGEQEIERYCHVAVLPGGHRR
jgi:gliding motility-associated-like protein